VRIVDVKALVTGGAGFIGSAIARRLLTEDNEVIILDNLSTGSTENLPQDAAFIRGNVHDLETARLACRDVEFVFHQAALGSVPRSVDDPLTSHESNVTGTLNMLIAAVEAGVQRVVYASSSSAYGDTQGAVANEEMPTDPLSPYAVTKLAAEHYCRVWTRVHGLSTVSLRYFNVFGPGQDPRSRYAAVFPRFISAVVSGRAPEIYGSGEQARDFTFIDDVVRANLAAARADANVDGVVCNIGAGRPRSVNEVLRAISSAVGRWIEPVHLPPRRGEVFRSHADVSRARDLLGWSPETDWDDAVATTVSWFDKTSA